MYLFNFSNQGKNTLAGKILLIEDDERVSELMVIILNRHGYEVTPALTAYDGMSLARSSKPDLILLDVMLPDQNGLEAYPHLRKIVGDIPILIMSANHRYKDTLAQYNIDQEMFLQKPISVGHLAKVVGSHLSYV